MHTNKDNEAAAFPKCWLLCFVSNFNCNRNPNCNYCCTRATSQRKHLFMQMLIYTSTPGHTCPSSMCIYIFNTVLLLFLCCDFTFSIKHGCGTQRDTFFLSLLMDLCQKCYREVSATLSEKYLWGCQRPWENIPFCAGKGTSQHAEALEKPYLSQEPGSKEWEQVQTHPDS